MKNKDNKIAFGYVAIMFAMLFWGLSFVWIKHLLNLSLQSFLSDWFWLLPFLLLC